MRHQVIPLECLLLFTVIGIVATFAAPWAELRGTYAAWRIVEWHTFWRGESAFQLANVVAPNYHVPIEYATITLQNTLRVLFVLGSALGAWHGAALTALLVAGARMRSRAGASRTRVTAEIIALVAVNAIALYLLTLLLALPSSLTPKVDFRAAADTHTASLIWSSVMILPIAPALAIVAAIGQVVALAMLLNRTRTSHALSEVEGADQRGLKTRSGD